MKGVVFTEFLDMVEQKFGYETVDHILTAEELKSGGIYTAVGTYEHAEMVQLITHLNAKTNIEVPTLLKEFGKYLFGTFQSNYGSFFDKASDSFSFLESIEQYIHVEVKKLYPDAELPKFESKRIGNNTLELVYYSERRMSDFAEGLIEKTLEHYKEVATIDKSLVKEDGSIVKFTIVKQ